MKVLPAASVAIMVALAGCDLGLPPKPERGPNIPADATLEYWPKIGWGWELCVDGPEGSALFTWSSHPGSGSFIAVRGQSCADANPREERNYLRVEGGPSHLSYLFPEAPLDFDDSVESAPCPYSIQPHELAGLVASLRAAAASSRLPADVARKAEAMAVAVENTGTGPLKMNGGEGNTDFWSVRCGPV